MNIKILLFLSLIIIIWQYIKTLKLLYKVGYYETKLEIEDFNIDHIKSISLFDMIFKD